jgi:hypothetical protein
MSWYRDVKNILAYEPENWLAYLYGQRLEDMPAFLKHSPRFKGTFARVVAFFGFLAKQTSWRRKPVLCGRKVDYLVFASSINQMSALSSTIFALRQGGQSVIGISKRNFIDSAERKELYSADAFSLLDSLKATLLFTLRAPRLYASLVGQHPAKRSWYFHHFCHTYPYLPYFLELFKNTRPDYVIVSNDHTCANRCCLAVAHYLGIRTVYMQHASVSTIFPALRVDYAFLDGKSALETYRQCERNQPDSPRDVPYPLVILSGQKKKLAASQPAAETARYIGIALNLLDNIDAGLDLTEKLATKGREVCLRWHPGQKPEEIRKIKARAAQWDSVILSDPKQEPPGDYLARLNLVVAGNTSILLEAAVVGVFPVYYELQPPQFPDYYGFVRNGLALHAKTPEHLEGLLSESSTSTGPNSAAVRYYSATYRTQWDGREGELVARCLEVLRAGGDVSDVAPATEIL